MGLALSYFAVVMLLLAGFAILALSQDRHRRAVAIRPLAPPTALRMRIAGYGLIVLALPPAIWSDGPGFGSLLWVTLMPVSAFVVVAVLTWRPSWLASMLKVTTVWRRALPARRGR